jgi:uncharacterized protein
MTPEERQLLAGLFQRVASTATTPRDAEAEAFINDAVRAQPHAPYVFTQTVLVQQQALEAATRRIQELEAQAQNQPPQTSFLGGLGKSLFGGGGAPPRSAYDAGGYPRQSGPAPQPQSQPYPPQAYPPPPAGPWGAAPVGGGFLQNALTTAAGVAGGLVVADSLRGLFGGHGGFGVGGLGAGGAGETIVNNYYDNADPAGQHAQDVLQDADQDQDDIQDASDSQDYSDDSGGGDSGSFDT